MMNKQEAILFLQEKLYRAPSVIQHAIFEATWMLESDKDVSKVLEWFNAIEIAYNKMPA